MNWKKIDDKIANSDGYRLFKKYGKLWTFIEGLIVIGLLIGIVLFAIQDFEVKSQIRDRCGYTTDTYECICDPHLVEGWKEMKQSGVLTLNLSNFNFTNSSNSVDVETS